MKKGIFYIFLFAFSSNYAQMQIPDRYVPVRFSYMNDISYGKLSGSQLIIPITSIDTSGLLDASDTINYYIDSAYKKWILNGSLYQESALVILPPGKFKIAKPILLKSRIRLWGESSEETEILCDVGEGKHCFVVSPENMGQSKNAVVSGQFKSKDSRNINVQFGDSLKSAPFEMYLLGYQTVNDSNLITSSWAKGSVEELFTALPQRKSGLDYEMSLTPFLREEWGLNGAPLLDYNYFETTYYRDEIFLINTHSKVNQYNYIYDAGIHCLSIKRLDTTTSQTSNILLQNAVACHVRGVRSEGCNFGHITLNRSAGCIIKRNHIFKGNGYGGGGKAYGIVLQQSSTQNTIVDNTMHRLRHSVLLQSGANKNAILANYSYDPYWEEVNLPADAAGDLVLHGNYPFGNVFEFNVAQQAVIDDSHGKNGPFNIFHRNLLQGYGIFMSVANGSDSQVFTGNDITNTSFLKGQYLLQDQGHFQYGNRVKGNLRPSGTGDALQKSVCYFNRNKHEDDTRRTGFSFSKITFIDMDSIPFGEPFTQGNGIPAWKNPMDFPSCVEGSDFYGTNTKRPNELANKTWFYPNPSQGEVNINQTGTLEVYNTLGQLLEVHFVKETAEEVKIKNKGLLILKLLDEENRVHVGRLHNQ